jgi:hypothetical protein
MGIRRTKAEYNIAKQSILDHCAQEKTINELTELIGLPRSTINNIARRMVSLEYLSVRYETRKSKDIKGMVHQVMHFTTIQPDVSGFLEHEELNVQNGRHYAQMKHKDDLPEAVTRPDWNSKYFRDKLALQSQEMRKERKSSRTYVGISPVYNG